MAQTFAFAYSDPLAASNLNGIFALVNSALTTANGCFVYYVPASNVLYLFDDSISSYKGPITPGGASTLSNNQCTLTGSGSSATSSGHTLTLNLALTFAAAFGGAKNIYLYDANQQNLNSGWQTRGTWTVPIANVPPTADSVLPLGNGLGADIHVRLLRFLGRHQSQCRVCLSKFRPNHGEWLLCLLRTFHQWSLPFQRRHGLYGSDRAG